MSDRKLLGLQYAVAALFAVLRLSGIGFGPNPELDCSGCQYPLWLAYPVPFYMIVLMGCLLVYTFVKTVIVLVTGSVSDDFVSRTAVPIVWILFFVIASVNFAIAGLHSQIEATYYDAWSFLFCYLFAVMDGIFALKARRGDAQAYAERPQYYR